MGLALKALNCHNLVTIELNKGSMTSLEHISWASFYYFFEMKKNIPMHIELSPNNTCLMVAVSTTQFQRNLAKDKFKEKKFPELLEVY